MGTGEEMLVYVDPPRCCLVPAPLPLAVSPVFGQSCFCAHPPLGIPSPRLGPPCFPSERSWTWVSFVARPALPLLMESLLGALLL